MNIVLIVFLCIAFLTITRIVRLYSVKADEYMWFFYWMLFAVSSKIAMIESKTFEQSQIYSWIGWGFTAWALWVLLKAMSIPYWDNRKLIVLMIEDSQNIMIN